jgi:ribosome-associated protein
MTSEATAKKNIQKLQRVIVDGLEDVKGQDIKVFNTEGLSPLFERVIVASGTSNRQTKALAASVRDAVREAGFDKPRMEGEDNGEWIIVDCGPAVVHVMQPGIRQYYRLEDIWGDKPVRMKHGEAKARPVRAAVAEPATAAPAPAKRAVTRRSAAPEATPAPAARKKTTARSVRPATPKASATVSVVKVGVPAKAPARKAAGKSPARKAATAKRSSAA